jgi:anti-sigma B factor antagonist
VSLVLSTSQQRASTVLNVTGDIDVYSAPELRAALAEIIGSDAPGVVLDLEGTDFIDSSALGVLVGANKQLESRHATLKLVCTKPHLLKVFEITKLSQVIPICASVDAATA